MKEQLKADDIFIYPCLGKHIYEWKNCENIFIDYPQIPLEFGYDKEDYVLIHVRAKGINAKQIFYSSVINNLLERKKKVVLIGNPSEVFIPEADKTVDLRGKTSTEEVMHLVGEARYMITCCSMFAYHRVLFNKPTIIFIGEQTEGVCPESIFQDAVHSNPNYLCVNSDAPLVEKVNERINEWFK